ncbi:MAG: MBL fold metallo-hydrolase [Chromatiales bacterium]|nr:MBL fold metallo-hydrolase [Chromatiales bacterium]
MKLKATMRASVLAFSALAAVAAAAEYAPVDVEMRLKQVSKHVYYVQGAAGIATDNAGFISNAGFVVTPEGVAVIDALGTPSLAAKMLGLIREITSAPIRYAIATHYHADHILGLQVFEGAGAEILGPTGSREYLEGLGKERLEERRFSLDPWVNDQTRLVWPTRWVESELKLELGGIQLTVTPQGAAHSKGDLTVYVEPDRVLFAGDLIFEGRTPFLGDANSRRWLENLEQMQTTGVAALVPGHGPAAMRPTEAIGATRDYLAYLREQMGAGVAELQGFDDTYSGVDWSRFANWPAFEEANRRNAYQVFLSMEAELFK